MRIPEVVFVWAIPFTTECRVIIYKYCAVYQFLRALFWYYIVIIVLIIIIRDRRWIKWQMSQCFRGWLQWAWTHQEDFTAKKYLYRLFILYEQYIVLQYIKMIYIVLQTKIDNNQLRMGLRDLQSPPPHKPKSPSEIYESSSAQTIVILT